MLSSRMIANPNPPRRIKTSLIAGCTLACVAAATAVLVIARDTAAPAFAQALVPRALGKDEGNPRRDPLPLPMWFSARLYDDRDDCVRAKLDIWFNRGRYTPSLFVADAGGHEPDLSRIDVGRGSMVARQTRDRGPELSVSSIVVDRGETTIILGTGDCRFRIRVDKPDS
jgi:hypothetical protein